MVHIHTDEEKHAKLQALELGLVIMVRDEIIIGVKASGEEVQLGKVLTKNLWRDVHHALDAYAKRMTNVVEKAPGNYDKLLVYTDGGSRGNPGPSASGYVILTPDEAVLEEGGEYLGITTNNQAEYQAVKLALESARKYNPKELHFHMDSLLVANQLNGIYKIRNRDLWPVHEAIKQLAAQYKKVIFTHVRREFNKLADAQVNVVLDSHEKSNR